MPDRLIVLVVDDDQADRLTIRQNLRQTQCNAELVEADSPAAARQRLACGGVDCVILDYRLADDDGLALLREIRQREGEAPQAGGLPVIVLTGYGDEMVAVEAMKAGATDYIPKSELSPPRLDSAIRTARELHRRRGEANHAQAVLQRTHAELEQRVRERTAGLEQAHAELRRQYAELDEFTFVASHDLQEPLRKLIAFGELLPRDVGGDLPTAARNDLRFITDAARRMQTLVQDLLTLSRVGQTALERGRVVLDVCADRALDALAARVNETGAEIVRDALPAVVGDATLLTQLYQNLIGNALKFTQNGTPPRIRLTAKPHDGQWVFGVQDNGIGVPPKYADQIFAPFKRLHSRDQFEGTGIGLAVCRKAVERHGGRIWVEAAPGQGAHFKFTLNGPVEVSVCRDPTQNQPSFCSPRTIPVTGS